MKYIIAKILRFLRFTPGVTTNIVDGKSVGYGKLDINGFWQFPLEDNGSWNDVFIK